MASRDDSRMSPKAVGTWLAVFVLLALGLRIGLNVDASFDEDTGRYLYSGNDPYYHDRTVNHILATGESLQFDPAINYPSGGYNPNPPVFDWTTAAVAGVAEAAGVSDPAGFALNLMVAVWGALAVIPIYMIGADLWNRRAGLWGAFFMAVSAPHIQRGVWGFADHDATTLFWIVLAVAFLVKGLKVLDDREYVRDWRHRNALASGLRASFAHNRTAMLWSALAGVALSATALTWKGYPYVLAIMAVAFGLQLLWDHVKNRDSTALMAFYLLPMLLVTLIPLPYYLNFPTFMDTTIWAGIYVLVGMVVVAAILVPTRDLPSIVVFPALAVAVAAGLAAMLWLLPEVGRTVFTGLGYFEQSKLFGTIAEAQRSELGRVAASFGFFTFLLAFWGLGRSVKVAWKRGAQEHVLMVSWAAVALFMAFAASRFIMNASPVFALLAGAVMPTITAKLGFDQVRRAYRQQHGQNKVAAGMRSLNMRTTVGVLLVFLLFVLPNVWIGVDAAIPCEVDDCTDPETKRLGAFGIDFDIQENGWLEVLHALSQHDQDIPNIADRPGFIAWWDYGHWATNIGKHPTVADPFQNHYNLAGRFLASESEQAAMAWLTILLVNTDYGRTEPVGEYSPHVEQALRDVDPALLEIGPMRGYDAEFALLQEHVDLEGDEIFDLYEGVGDYTGAVGTRRTVEYFAVDQRMYPISARNPGIFYAPAFLANKNPDDFIQYTATGGGLQLELEQYGIDDVGSSFRIEPRWVDQNGGEWQVSGGQAFPAGTPLGAQSQGVPVQQSFQPTQAFFDSMYARAFGHQQNGFTPGAGLSHWRVLEQSDNSAVDLLAYYHGVSVSGRVTDDSGASLDGVEVTFVDGFGAHHAVATTDADGTFTVLAPFSVEDENGTGDLRLVVNAGGTILAESDAFQFSREQARFGDTVTGAELTVERATFNGTVFQDADGDGAFGENETVVAGAVVSVGDQNVTTGPDGTYRFPAVQPGAVTVTVSAPGYQGASRSVTLEAGQSSTQDFGLTASASDVTFVLEDQDGQRVAQVPFTVSDGEDRQATTDTNGTADLSLAPGDYTLTVDYAVTQAGEEARYEADRSFTVAFGGEDQTVTVQVTRS